MPNGALFLFGAGSRLFMRSFAGREAPLLRRGRENYLVVFIYVVCRRGIFEEKQIFVICMKVVTLKTKSNRKLEKSRVLNCGIIFGVSIKSLKNYIHLIHIVQFYISLFRFVNFQIAGFKC